MNTLIIDCSAGMNIILQTDEKTYQILDTNQKKHTDELLLSVDKLLSDANLSIKQISNLCVCVGPGSFTGIRVAIAICKGLSIGTGAKIFVCSNFDIYSYGNSEESIYILDGFSDYVYCRIKSENKIIDSCEHISDLISKIKTDFNNYKIYVQSEKLSNMLNENDLKCELVSNHILELFNLKINNNDYTEINQITPIYLRASQAEIERNKKLKEQQ